MKILGIVLVLLYSSLIFAQRGGAAWREEFIGKIKFELTDDPEFATLKSTVLSLEDDLTVKDKQLKVNKKKLKAAKEVIASNKPKIDKNKTLIQENKALITSLIEKNKANQVKLVTVKDKLKKKNLKVKKLSDELVPLKEKQALKKKKFLRTKKQCMTGKIPKEECDKTLPALEQELSKISDKIGAKETVLSEEKKIQSDLSEKKENLSSSIAKNKEKTKKKKTQNESLVAQNIKLKKGLDQAKLELSELKKTVLRLEKRVASLKNQIQSRKVELKSYKQQLITKILRLNKKGAEIGRKDGRFDGRNEATRVGIAYGQKDGLEQGYITGEQLGIAREEQLGLEDGSLEGSKQGNKDGSHKGEIEGTIAGNVAVAIVEASKKAKVDATGSNASARGAALGRDAGKKEAIEDGQTIGSKQGIQKSIKKNEEKVLKNTTINGTFAGAFSGEIPDLPAGFRGPSFRPKGQARKPILRKARRAGYVHTYKKSSRRAYNKNIEREYSINFDQAFSSAKAEAMSVFYQVAYDNSYKNAFDSSYKQSFDSSYASLFRQFENQFLARPNRVAPEFKKQFNETYLEVFEELAGEILKAAFDKAKAEVYDSMISSEIQKNENKSFQETENVYASNPVLKYEKSTYYDGGINNVGKADDVYQPGEEVIQNVIIKNFGGKTAQNVMLKMNGEISKISIPAKSIVTIKGASKTKISKLKSIGEIEKVQTELSLDLSSNNSIVSKHFENASSGLIAMEQTNLMIQNPLKISTPQVESALKTGANNLILKVSNISSKPYSGDLELSVDGIHNFKKNIKLSVSNLSGEKVLNIGSLVIDKSEGLKSMSLNAKILKNNVLLGMSEKSSSKLVHIPFTASDSNIVVAVSPSTQSDLALDVISELGGLSEVSVLDTEYAPNSKFLSKPLSNKAIILLGANDKMRQIVKTSENVSLISVSQNLESVKQSILPEAVKIIAGVDSMLIGQSMKNTPVVVVSSELYELKKKLLSSKIYNLPKTSIISQIEKVRSDEEKVMELFNNQQIIEVIHLSSMLKTMSKKEKKKVFDKPEKYSKLSVFSFNTSTQNKTVLAFGYNAEKLFNAIRDNDDLRSVVNSDLMKTLTGKGLFKKSKLKFLGELGKKLKTIDVNLFEKVKEGRPLWMQSASANI